MVLLTQSHASILLSTAIVLFFTTALFLSGFAIQRRTLRDLRAAIKPQAHQPSPKIVLPDRFRAQTTELDDGTVVVVLESEAEREAREMDQAIILRGGGATDDDDDDDKVNREEKNKGVVVVTTGQDRTSAQASLNDDGKEQEDVVVVAAAPAQKEISRAERRRLIKEELHKLAQGDKKVAYQRRVW